ncbi:MAG: glucokinase [Gammaproteobacteria bacterium]
MRILAGDIGGTKTWLRIAEFSTEFKTGRVLREQRYPSEDFDGLMPIIRKFMDVESENPTPNIVSACFGVAGPIAQTARGQSVKVTNLPWEISTQSLGTDTGIEKIKLINDFQAIGYGIEALEEDDLAVLQKGEAQERAPRIVIGPGTGLGVALMVWQGDHYEVISSEGGHADFAPVDTVQSRLLNYLTERLGHVSYERVLSGPGLVNIYEFLCAQHGGQSSVELARSLDIDDPAAAITQSALTEGNTLAIQSVDIFISICGAYAGNLALIALAQGGVYIAGGIAPRLLDAFCSGSFTRSFNNKGRLSALQARVPVKLILNTQVGLLGAALAASRL